MPDKMSGISLKCEGDSIMRTECPECKVLYDVDDSAAGSLAQCKKCGVKFTVAATFAEVKNAPQTMPQAAAKMMSKTAEKRTRGSRAANDKDTVSALSDEL